MNTSPAQPALPGDGVAFAAWTLGQAAVVAVYAAGIKLAGGYPAPPEATADLGLAVTQLILAAAFAPVLFTGHGQNLRVAAIGLAWTTLAARLAGRSVGEVVPTLFVVIAWSAAVAAWRRQPAARVGLTFLTLVGPVLFYLSMEYGSHPLTLGDWPTLLSPPLGAATTRFHNERFWPLLPPLLLLAGPTLRRFSTRRTARDRSEN